MTGSANLIVLGTVSEMEHLQTKNGKLWIKLLVEVKTWRRGGDGEAGQEETTLISINLFSRVAETAGTYLRIGDPVGVTCRVSGTEYKADGKIKRGITLTADQLHLISNGGGSAPIARPIPTQQKFRSSFKPSHRAVTTNEYGEPSDINF